MPAKMELKPKNTMSVLNNTLDGDTNEVNSTDTGNNKRLHLIYMVTYTFNSFNQSRNVIFLFHTTIFIHMNCNRQDEKENYCCAYQLQT